MLDLTRQSGLIPTEDAQKTRVLIVGAGAIGSHLAEVLAKMGVGHITVMDYDTIESHNLPNQGFSLADIGKTKVGALQTRLVESTGVDFTALEEKLEKPRSFDCDFIISAVDLMAARRIIFDSFVQSDACQAMIDGRMGARFARVFYVPKDVARMTSYEETLISDGDAYQEPCTQKSTIFCAYGIAALMGALLAKKLMGETPQQSADCDFANLIMDRVVA